MYRFTIELAETPIEINTSREAFKGRCRDYLSEKPAEFSVSVSDADIEFERECAKAEEPFEWQLEWMAIYRKICSGMYGKDTVLMHGSSLAVDGRAYLFCAPSGTGKSTHTRLWRQYLGDRVLMINDDKPLVRVKDSKVRIYGTPWNGKHHIGTNTSAPLHAVCFLERGRENALTPLDSDSALPQLLKYIYRPEDPAQMLQMLDTAAKISGLSGFYSLRCNMDQSAAEIAYKGMSGL